MTSQRPDAPIPGTSINLLGGFDVRIDGEPMPRLRSRKGQVLLALLVVRAGKPVDRSWLAGSLWPDSTEAQALASVRQTLSDLRRALGSQSGMIESPSSRTLLFRRGDIPIDVLDFDAAVGRGDPASAMYAVELYKGPLLDGSTDETIWPDRQAREALFLNALETAASGAQAAHETTIAVNLFRRLVSADPYRESAYQSLMQVLGDNGDFPEAYLVYRALRRRLSEDLRAQPSPASVAIYEQVRKLARKRVTSDDGAENARRASTLHVAERIVDIPAPLSSLIGRDNEVTAVRARLEAARLVTLTGFGGVGKTRLAIAVARSLEERYRDGVRFVDLTEVQDGASAMKAVIDALRYEDDPARLGADTGFKQVRRGQFLLVLDNCEQILSECADIASRVLRAYPSVRILATSRRALGLAGEVVYTVAPLGLPDVNLSASTDSALASDLAPVLIQSEAVQLFLARAAAASPGFVLSGDNGAAIAAICRELEGLPLAIELAASRVNVLSIEEIAQRILTSYSHLGSCRQGFPSRHKSIRAAIDWSYALLTDMARVVFARLGVFKDGCTLDAVESVCGILGIDPGDMLDILAHMVDSSLVTVTWTYGNRARYRLLKIVRQYALDKLAEHDDNIPAVHAAYIRYYTELAVSNSMTERPGVTRGRFDRIDSDLANILSASDLGLASQATSLTSAEALAGISPYWTVRGDIAVGLASLTNAFDVIGGLSTASKVLPRVLVSAANLEILAGRASLALAHARRAAAATDGGGDLEVSNLSAVVQACAHLAAHDTSAARQSLGDRQSSVALRLRAYAAAQDGRDGDALDQIAKVAAGVGNAAGEIDAAWNLIAYGRIAAVSNTDDGVAWRAFTAALAIADEWGATTIAAAGFEGMASLMASRKDFTKAALLIEAADTIRRETGFNGWLLIDPDSVKRQVKASLDVKKYAAQAQAARRLSLPGAISAAID